jgi:hypothetical protein
LFVQDATYLSCTFNIGNRFRSKIIHDIVQPIFILDASLTNKLVINIVQTHPSKRAQPVLMKVAREAFWAILASAWIVGLVDQFGSWPMMAFYVAISLAMIGVMFGHRGMLNFAKRPPANKSRKL